MSEPIVRTLASVASPQVCMPYDGVAGAHLFTGTVSGAGSVSAAVAVEGSNDLIGWSPIVTLSPSGSGSAVASASTSNSYRYVRANVSAVTGQLIVKMASETVEADTAVPPGMKPVYATLSDGGIGKVYAGDSLLFSLTPFGITPVANNIGDAGLAGFGVGICPTLPAGFTQLPGTTDPASDNYGNYQYSDGSIMVWVPRFYYRIGSQASPRYATYGVNAIDIVGDSAFGSEADANSAGYALHRAFFDGGPQLGFFVDKYQCSNNGGIASSVRYGAPLSTATVHNPISALGGAPTNTFGGTITAAKTRGGAFHPASIFIYSALAMLSMAHGQAATASTCAWYDATGVSNFPKGNNNNALRDVNDASVLYVSDGYSNCGQTGSATPFAKTTHNGQACGIADLNGNMYEVALGIQCVATSKAITAITQANPAVCTAAAHGFVTGDAVLIASGAGMTALNDRLYTITVLTADTFALDGIDASALPAYTGSATATRGTFYAAKTTARMRDFTEGVTLASDHWGAVGAAANFQAITPRFRTDYPNNGAAQRFGNAGAQVLSSATAGNDWILTGAGQPQAGGVSAAGSNQFGADYFYQYARNEMCLIAGGNWSVASSAGVWGVNWSLARATSANYVGFRAASYL